jgi:CelD/BcsL family acetyltransferase involved in cellulose biosynthesis
MLASRAEPSAEASWRLDEWREVVARLEDPHPFVLPEWQRAWWAHLGSGRLSVLPLRDGEAVAGVAALYGDRDGVLRPLGDPRVTDYPGPAVAPGCAVAAAEALVRRLCAERGSWSALDVRDQRPEDGFGAALAAAARARGLSVVVGGDEPVALLRLPGSHDAHLAALSAHTRHELRRKQRRLERLAGPTQVRTATAATLGSDLRTFAALFRRARPPKGTFLTAPIEAFLRQVCLALLGPGALRLDLLEAEGRPLAAALGFASPRSYRLYNMAFDPAAGAASPGIVLVDRLIERAIREELEVFDFLRGTERYKLELGAVPSRLQRVEVRP